MENYVPKRHAGRRWVLVGAVAVMAVGCALFALKSSDANTEPPAESPVRKTIACPKNAPEKSACMAKAPAEKPKAPSGKDAERPTGGEANNEAERKVDEATKKEDNPFPRYLEMFKNDPEALAREYAKELEADRAEQVKMRKWVVDELHLNAEQAEFVESVMDGLMEAVLQHNQDEVDLIASGQLNEDSAADGGIWNGNRLAMQKHVLARNELVLKAAEEMYEHLAVEDVPDAKKQNVLFQSAYQTSFAFETLAPYLGVYDKVYKNMGVGKGLFSWCRRPH